MIEFTIVNYCTRRKHFSEGKKNENKTPDYRVVAFQEMVSFFFNFYFIA